MPAPVKDADLQVVKERLAALSERVTEIGDGQDRNDDAVAQLASALTGLVDRMRKQDRILSLNSFVAYALFTVLLGAAFFMLYRGRADDLVRERDQAVSALRVAEERAQSATRELAARDQAEKSAMEVYALVRDHRYKEAIAAESKLGEMRLTPAERGLLGDALADSRDALASEALERSREALARGELDRALKEARAALEVAPKSDAAAELHYVIGSGLIKQGKHEDAVPELQRALSAGVERSVGDARYRLAETLDRLGRRAEAREAYRGFAQTAPKHSLASWARKRSWQLAGPAKTPGAGKAAPAAATPAATPE